MKPNSTTHLAFPLYCLLAYFLMVRPVVGQADEEGPWWPNQLWGPGDQAGGSNWITPEKVLEVLSLVKTGKIYELGHVYEPGIPLFGQRIYKLVISGSPTGGPAGKNALITHDEYRGRTYSTSGEILISKPRDESLGYNMEPCLWH